MGLSREKFFEIKERFERAIGPIAAGFILDLVDLATYGVVGLLSGLLIGSVVGWYLTGVLRVPNKWRPALSMLAGIYCMMPGTEFIPVGTIVGACVRFFDPPAKKDHDAQ